MESDNFHGRLPSNKIPETGFHQQTVKTVAYLRVSTAQQDAGSQRLAILEYARKHDFHIDDFFEATELGRPKGSLGVSRLDGKEDEIRRFLRLGVSKSAIAKITGVSRQTLYHFIGTRGLSPGA